MDKQECISQLEDLKKHCMDWSPESPWDKDVQALDMAIAALKGTAPEVPVQEQLIKEILSEISILLITASSITKKALEDNFIG
ncbi:hypothetical protein [Clostridium sp. UBA7791]|uniref:hypothetical protein n=1 Tax=Clostridium sp. UBA7791 TaxID=1946379 RepID=UPI0032168C56